MLAFIHEEHCIGCTKCIDACPENAIIGAAKHTHTVVTSLCTGCDLCLDPCPTDCIEMLAIFNPKQKIALPKKVAAFKEDLPLDYQAITQNISKAAIIAAAVARVRASKALAH